METMTDSSWFGAGGTVPRNQAGSNLSCFFVALSHLVLSNLWFVFYG